MGKFLSYLLLAGLVAGAVYLFIVYPAGCAKLTDDARRDVAEISRQVHIVHESGKNDWGHVTPYMLKLTRDVVNDSARIMSSLSTNLAPETASPPAPVMALSASESEQAPPSAWHAPSPFPAKPGWRWTTIAGQTFSNVRILGMERDSVMIDYTGGAQNIPVSDLPADLQKELGYKAEPRTAAAEEEKQPEEKAPQAQAPVNAPPTSAQHLSESNDYDRGLAEARSSGKRVLLYFTGSDWCPWCQKMDREVLSTSEFQNFAAPRFVMVTVDFPHESFQTDDEKQRNTALAAKYGVSGYPTLIATDANGQKLTLLDGYPNGGMDAVIGMLKNLPP